MENFLVKLLNLTLWTIPFSTAGISSSSATSGPEFSGFPTETMTSPTAELPLFLRPCFIDRQRASVEDLRVQLLYGSRNVDLGPQFDEGKSARSPGVHVAHYSDALCFDIQARAELTKVRVSDVEGDIPDK
jgi:hypothetical protein